MFFTPRKKVFSSLGCQSFSAQKAQKDPENHRIFNGPSICTCITIVQVNADGTCISVSTCITEAHGPLVHVLTVVHDLTLMG